MAKNTTRQGANFELDIMHYLAGCRCEYTHKTPKHRGWRGFGYDAGRSSGSRGKVDVWAIGALDGGEPLLLIQAKTSIKAASLSPADREGLRDLGLRSNGLPLVAFKATDLKTGYYRPHFRQLTGLGSKDWELWTPGEDD